MAHGHGSGRRRRSSAVVDGVRSGDGNVVDADDGDSSVRMETMSKLPTADELRRARTEYFEKPPKERERAYREALAAHARHSSGAHEAEKVRQRRDPDRATSGRKRDSGVKHSKTSDARARDDSESEFVYAREPVGVEIRGRKDGHPASFVRQAAAEKSSSRTKKSADRTTRHRSRRDVSPKRSRRESENDSYVKRAQGERRTSSSGRKRDGEESSGREYSTFSFLRPALRRSKTSKETDVCFYDTSTGKSESYRSHAPVSSISKTAKSEHRRSTVHEKHSSKPPEKAPPRMMEKISCDICVEDVPKSRVERLSCSHTWCHTCLRRMYTDTDLKSPPKCCDTTIPRECAEKVLSSDELHLWKKRMREAREHNPLYCPRPGCNYWITPNHFFRDRRSGLKYGECTKCKTRACPHCKKEWHRGGACPEDPDTKAVLDLAEKEGWKKCYKCGHVVEKSHGCNHMSCTCGAQFCYKCGEAYHDGRKACECNLFDYDDDEDEDDIRPLPGEWFPVPRALQQFLTGFAQPRGDIIDEALQGVDIMLQGMFLQDARNQRQRARDAGDGGHEAPQPHRMPFREPGRPASGPPFRWEP